MLEENAVTFTANDLLIVFLIGLIIGLWLNSGGRNGYYD